MGSTPSRGESAPPAPACACFFLPLSSYRIPPRSRYFPGLCDMNLIPRGGEEDWIWFPAACADSPTSGLFKERQLLPPTALIILWFLSLYCQCPKWNALPFVSPETIPQNCFQFMNGFGYLRTSFLAKSQLSKNPHPALFLSALPNLMFQKQRLCTVWLLQPSLQALSSLSQNRKAGEELRPRPLDLPGRQRVFMWMYWADHLSCVDRDEL